MAERKFAAIILAAGHGTRMRSSLPKMLHRAAGRPLLEHVLRAVRPLGPERILIVVGHGAEQIRRRFEGEGVEFVLQEKQLGTGDALRSALPHLGSFDGDLMVLTGDSPLLTPETLASLRDGHQSGRFGMTLLSYRVADPTGLGRLVRDENGELLRIVEERDATDAERQIDEICPGLFIFDRNVAEMVSELSDDNAQGEYYITDLPGIYLSKGSRVGIIVGQDETALLVGVNDREQLAAAERILRERIRRHWLAQGVTMLAPEQTFIDDTVELGRDVLLEPGVILRGGVRLGEGVRVGAYSILEDVVVEPGSVVRPHTVSTGTNGVSD